MIPKNWFWPVQIFSLGDAPPDFYFKLSQHRFTRRTSNGYCKLVLGCTSNLQNTQIAYLLVNMASGNSENQEVSMGQQLTTGECSPPFTAASSLLWAQSPEMKFGSESSAQFWTSSRLGTAVLQAQLKASNKPPICDLWYGLHKWFLFRIIYGLTWDVHPRQWLIMANPTQTWIIKMDTPMPWEISK